MRFLLTPDPLMTYEGLTQKDEGPLGLPIRRPGIFLPSLLFLLTFLTTTLSGVQWAYRDPLELTNFPLGIKYSVSVLFVLAAHEFGHFFAARFHNIKTTMPYFIPFPPLPIINFGTLGAVIRTQSAIPSRKVMFDIGVAGPLAGFVACLCVLIYGFVTLPGPEYLLAIHPDFDFKFNAVPNTGGISLEFGETLLFSFLRDFITNPTAQFVPPMTEVYHYPFLCVGWFGLFVTAMNLIPIGQFDGGHIMYTMFGERHKSIARSAFFALLILGLPSVIELAFSMITGSRTHQIPLSNYSWFGWILWALISYYVVKLYHPLIPDQTPLDKKRVILGWVAIGIFVISFSPVPFSPTF